ncbi:hypothetical protein CYMTET_24410 [Cymbomonas tetramitiformis]|uniref:GYF domain-containing protein n=1 Tax=Cymbomonas tetramitiformis TaxID=36881 RepID=A0AAE0FVY0_9CHLO|nr:hypothetical protein CYMTET_24410 [Cymbomonas tetramitiformis]
MPIAGDEENSETWFYVGGDGEEHGPVNFRIVRAHLRLGLLDPETLVWKEGMPDWCASNQVDVFKSCAPGQGMSSSNKIAMQTSVPFPPASKAFAPRVTTPLAAVPDFVSSGADKPPQSERLGRSLASPREHFALSAPPATSASDLDEWFFLAADGEEKGPVGTVEMGRLLRMRVVNPTSWVWSATLQPDWCQIADVPTLNAQLMQGSPMKSGAPGGTLPSVDQEGDGEPDHSGDFSEQGSGDEDQGQPGPPPVRLAPPASSVQREEGATAATAATGHELHLKSLNVQKLLDSRESDPEVLRAALRDIFEKHTDVSNKLKISKSKLRQAKEELLIKGREVEVLQRMATKAREAAQRLHEEPPNSMGEDERRELTRRIRDADSNASEKEQLLMLATQRLADKDTEIADKDAELARARATLQSDLSWFFTSGTNLNGSPHPGNPASAHSGNSPDIATTHTDESRHESQSQPSEKPSSTGPPPSKVKVSLKSLHAKAARKGSVAHPDWVRY